MIEIITAGILVYLAIAIATFKLFMAYTAWFIGFFVLLMALGVAARIMRKKK